MRKKGIYKSQEVIRDRGCHLVSAHPDLRKKIMAEYKAITRNASGTLGRMLRVKENRHVGMNDGLIYPGTIYPLGTPAHVARNAARDRAPIRGTVRAIVVLVDFSDKQFAAAHTVQHFKDLFFSQGVLAKKSLREYYTEVSNGLVDVVGDVVGPYRMSKKLEEYANGQSGTGDTDPSARDFALEAAKAADADVDYSLYDNNGDGFVDAFIVIHAGSGAEVTGSADDIWSHKWVFRGGSYSADNVQLYSYLTVPEDSRVGVCCHELGHLLFGLPDLYDTDYSSEGIGDWCLMSGGSWNDGGDTPAHPSAWCKADQGWASVVVQQANATVSLQNVEQGHAIYRLWKDGQSGSEYFLVENRQNIGFDAALPGTGLLIWHVDDAVADNATEAHPKVALEQADARDDLGSGNNRGDAGDPYPGSSNNTTFNATSSPNSKSYAGSATCVAVDSIGASGATMSARFSVRCGKSLLPKELKEPLKERVKENLKEPLKERVKENLKEPLKERIKENLKEPLKERVKENLKEPLKERLKEDLKEPKEIKEYREKEPKEFKEVAEKPWDHGWERPGGEWVTPETAQPIEARLAALEARIACLEPFITGELRPDLREGALRNEEDLMNLRSNMLEASAQAKREFDTKLPER